MRVTNTIPARAMVRLELGQNGFNYLEFLVETRAGRTRAIDWFQLTTGELVSVTIGGVAQLLTTNDPSLLGRLLGLERVDASALKQLQKIGELKRAGKYAETLAALRQLPGPMANSRIMLTTQAQMAILSKQDDEYDRILTTLAEKYSADPAVSFMLVDYYFARKDLPNTLKGIQTMEKRVGVDAVTQQLRAVTYLTNGDPVSGLKFSEESIKLEPDRLGGHDIRATALVALGRYPDAVASYRGMEKQFNLHFSRDLFKDDPAFAKFVASAAFRGWLPQ
jgi:tetratricopeptide (TPR) repeat protein